MSFPTPAVLPYSFQSDLGTTHGTHLDADFVELRDTINDVLTQLQLIQRDDGDVRNGTVHAQAFTSDSLALMAGSSIASTTVEWKPRGAWVTATLYKIGNIVETGTPAVAYACAVEHVSGTFATDYAAYKWVVLSSPRTLVSADIVSGLGYTPVNKAGDTMLGALTLTTGSKIAGSSGMTIYDSHLAQDLVRVNKGFYSAYDTSVSDLAYGFAANVVRSSGTYVTVGSQCSAIANGTAATMFGANFNALGLAGHTGALIGLEIDVGAFTPESTAAKLGLYLLFANRASTNPGQYNYVLPSGTYTNTGQGLGSNYYNKQSIAIQIESGSRSATGEFCGWTRGIRFGEYALDAEKDAAYPSTTAYPIGIDFSSIHYFGGTDPVTAYNLEAAIAMRDFQCVWWNRDPATAATATNKIRSYFNPATARWVLMNGNTERFGVDVATGTLYSNGAAMSSISLTGNNTWSGTNVYTGQVTISSSNLNFLGNACRITGDFSNASIPLRTIVQTSQANSATEWGLIPSGTGGVTAFYMLNSATAANCQVARISMDSTQFQIAAGITGAATYIPITFGTTGSERMRIDSSIGQVIIAATAVTNSNAKLRVNGIIQCDNPVAFSVHRNGVVQAVANSTPTAIDWTTEVFDTNSSFDLVTERFTPPAGKYALSGSCLSTSVGCAIVVSVYKNGVAEKSGNVAQSDAAGPSAVSSQITCIVDANGTDYFQLYVTQVSGAGMNVSGLATDTWFQGYRIG